jgi:glutathione S-transferase
METHMIRSNENLTARHPEDIANLLPLTPAQLRERRARWDAWETVIDAESALSAAALALQSRKREPGIAGDMARLLSRAYQNFEKELSTITPQLRAANQSEEADSKHLDAELEEIKEGLAELYE